MCRASRGSVGPESPGRAGTERSAFRESLGSRKRGSAGRPLPPAWAFCRRGSLTAEGGPISPWEALPELCCRRVFKMEVTLLPPSSSSLEYQLPVSPGRKEERAQLMKGNSSPAPTRRSPRRVPSPLGAAHTPTRLRVLPKRGTACDGLGPPAVSFSRPERPESRKDPALPLPPARSRPRFHHDRCQQPCPLRLWPALPVFFRRPAPLASPAMCSSRCRAFSPRRSEQPCSLKNSAPTPTFLW